MKIVFERPAADFLARMPKADSAALRRKLDRFAAEPFAPHGFAKRMAGSAEQVRVRHGNYRALCRIERDALIVIVFKVGHRKDVYE
jgi:mRNA interferase RelE/StbE